MNHKIETGSYTIGAFARSLGLSRRTIDFYTRQGLLHPDQKGSSRGYRRYNEEDRRRVTLIKQLQARKFTLQEIRQALQPNRDSNAGSVVGAMEKVAVDLEKLQSLIEETRLSASAADQPAVRAVATEALQRATALCSLLVGVLQEIPPL
jgi:MerR family copper efflux transcriptional regulator